MKKIASDVHSDSKTVKSHLMYGLEYDSLLTWILSTNSTKRYKDGDGKDVSIKEIMWSDSTRVGKYQNSNLNASSQSSALMKFNEVWGLAGNLDELTQETINGKRVGIGGSYAVKGGTRPVARRHAYDKLYSEMAIHYNDYLEETIGMRTALYITPELERVEWDPNLAFSYEQENKVKETVNGVTLVYESEETKYVAVPAGIKLYKEPKIEGKESEKLNFGKEVVMLAGEENVQTIDGKELQWSKVRVVLDNGKEAEGFVNGKDLSSEKTIFGETEFVMFNKPLDRYYNAKALIFGSPYEGEEFIDQRVNFSGFLEIIGKSIDEKQQWSVFKYSDDNYGFILSSDLREQGMKKNIEDYTFVFQSHDIPMYVSEDGTKVYDSPDGNETKKINKGTKVLIEAISTDGVWLRIHPDNNDNTFEYVKREELSLDEVTAENSSTSRAKRDIEGLEKAINKDNISKTITKVSNNSNMLYVTRASGVYIYEKEDSESNKIAWVKAGEAVEVIEQDPSSYGYIDWVKVKYKNAGMEYIGYVYESSSLRKGASWQFRGFSWSRYLRNYSNLF